MGSGSDLRSQSFLYEKGDLFSEVKFGEHKTSPLHSYSSPFKPNSWQLPLGDVNFSKRELSLASNCLDLARFGAHSLSFVACFAIQKFNSFLCYTNIFCVCA